MPREIEAAEALPIDAFGDGGFRIAGERHDGPALIIGATLSGWAFSGDAKTLSVDDFAPFLTQRDAPDMVILGTGERLSHPPGAVRQAFREARIGLEVLDTATACRTYNLLASEGRRIGAALLAV